MCFHFCKGDIWFRLLHRLLDELNTPLAQCGSGSWSIRYVWERCGYPVRAGQGLWRPYEILSPTLQLQMLEAAANAIKLLESHVVRSQGERAALFMPAPQTGFTTGFTAVQKKVEPVDYWKEAIEAINEAYVLLSSENGTHIGYVIHGVTSRFGYGIGVYPYAISIFVNNRGLMLSGTKTHVKGFW